MGLRLGFRVRVRVRVRVQVKVRDTDRDRVSVGVRVRVVTGPLAHAQGSWIRMHTSSAANIACSPAGNRRFWSGWFWSWETPVVPHNVSSRAFFRYQRFKQGGVGIL